MESKNEKCCICGKELIGPAKKPFGVIDELDYKVKAWKNSDYCCEDCFTKYVLPSKAFMIQAKQIVELLDKTDITDALVQLDYLYNNRRITESMYNYIIANWQLLHAKLKRRRS